MNYQECEGVEVSFSEALREVRKHQASAVEFLDDMGNHENYDAQAVLHWLGY